MDSRYSFLKVEKRITVESVISLIDAHHGADFYFEGESHNFWEMVYVCGGTVGITADDRIYTLVPGDIIFHKPMEFHKIYSCNNKPIHVYIFSFDAFGNGLAQLENRTFRLSEQGSAAVSAIMAAGKAAFETRHGIILGTRDAAAAQTYINLTENFLLRPEADDTVSSNRDGESRIFSDIMRVLEQNISQNITLDFVARECCISSSGLKKIFRRYTGMGVIAYFTKIKIKKSLELLDSGASVRETAEALSFSSPFYFSSVFKKELGIPPSEYRRRNKNENR